jgi:hypothetical protein
MRSFNLIKGFLGALRTAIVQGGHFQDICCQLSLWENDHAEYPQGSPILEIIPGQFATLGWDAGGGIQDTAIRGEIQFRIIVMNVLDFAQTDQLVITSTDQTLGIYELADQLIADIQMFDGCDGTGNSYLVEPMRIKTIGKPTRSEAHPEWCIVNLRFEATICQTITGVS